MPMCSRPGCVAQATDGDLCGIHAARVGKPCYACHGSGTLKREVGRKWIDDPCAVCAGTGLADQKLAAPRTARDADPVDKRDLMRLMNE